MMSTLSSSAHVNRDGGFGDRFWYWRGLSGRAYIHSIYAADSCPPVPGAVYVAVRRDGAGRRVPLGVGRLPAICGIGAAVLPGEIAAQGRVDEIHVHLLAETTAEAHAVTEDLRAALAPHEAVAPARPVVATPARTGPRPRRAPRRRAGTDHGRQLSLWPVIGEAAPEAETGAPLSA